MNYPDHATYEKLYKRYFKEDRLFALLDAVGRDFQGLRVLDLCGGGGRVTIETLRRGAKHVVLVDQSNAMIPPFLDDSAADIPSPLKESILSILVQPVDVTMYKMPDNNIDVAICQQGVNYWLDRHSIHHLRRILRPAGIFVFNTFHKKPSETPKVLQYTIDEKAYCEVSCLVGDTVHHVQMCEGIEPHYTEFKWLSPETISSLLSGFFKWEVRISGSSVIYRCISLP